MYIGSHFVILLVNILIYSCVFMFSWKCLILFIFIHPSVIAQCLDGVFLWAVLNLNSDTKGMIELLLHVLVVCILCC
jgi:hypothetical protein